VTIDLDPTDDPTHGAQQLSFFNVHYDNWCYLPVLGFVSFNEEAEQYLCAAVLRPGNVTAAMVQWGCCDVWGRSFITVFLGCKFGFGWMLATSVIRLVDDSPGNPGPSRASSPSVNWPSRPVLRLRDEASPKPFAQRHNRNQINHIYYQWFKLTFGSKTDR
jgi:hypothetical protein